MVFYKIGNKDLFYRFLFFCKTLSIIENIVSINIPKKEKGEKYIIFNFDFLKIFLIM